MSETGASNFKPRESEGKKVMLCYGMLCYVMLCYVMLCYVMLCYVMLCYVMLCYVMLYYVMLCYVMFNLNISKGMVFSWVIYLSVCPTGDFNV